MDDDRNPGWSIGGAVMAGCMFIGAGIGFMVGDVKIGGAFGMGVGFIAMAGIWAVYNKKR
jgi:hypothetical protein